MRDRCYNPNADNFEFYGGRGITVCDRWVNDYDAFFDDMGERPEGKSIERRDTNGNYEPDNCYWATKSEQMRNRRNAAMITFQGHEKSIVEWAEIFGIPWSTVKAWVKRKSTDRMIQKYFEGLDL